jgi:hypothetical protein
MIYGTDGAEIGKRARSQELANFTIIGPALEL